MKNIHVLPTDKPSRIFEILQFNFVFDNQNKYSEEYKKLHSYKNKNIYITSNEEIKDKDWVLFTITDITEIVKVTKINNNAFDSKEGFGYGLEYCKKIILTTDQDLIKDGIQPIGDEFLEWFISKANDSGKPIDIVEVHKMCYGALSGFSDAGYKIIIPKEEPKQDETEYLLSTETNKKRLLEDVKQETLEQAKKIAWDNYEHKEGCLYSNTFNDGFDLGVKWQQERMYSELIELWQQRQIKYENLAEKYKDNEHNFKKFTYKAMATRDCWKELLKIIENEK